MKKLTKIEAIKIALMLAVSVCVAFYAIPKIEEANTAINYTEAAMPKCDSFCFDDINADLVKIGHQKNSPSGKTLYVIQVIGGFNGDKNVSFSKKIEYVIANYKSSDELLLLVDSNGGNVGECIKMAGEVQSVKDERVKTTSLTTYASFSCGYYLASTSDVYLASYGSSIGNIGSLSMLRAKSHSSVNKCVASTQIKAYFGGCGEFDEDKLKSMIIKKNNETYDRFKSHVRLNRNIKDEIALSGDMFFAKDALDLGLIDGIKSKEQLFREYHNNNFKIIKIKVSGE